ncbi:acid protease [Trametes versicolor FP-101664 SS1]|uniref:acid protease n=1 Tax=Trametes versicolor (strain FP-101664) TaxID=717944 RepID=UPI000462265F|nr:acid protease [Trametes versicolor FP-101664 SS1]EIW52253.1 acid protease [Trametes versicolor FP-101664 SS1]
MHLLAANTPDARVWKGKERAVAGGSRLDARDEGTGGTDGIVIPLQLLSESAYQSVYVAPVLVGPNHNQYLLQVDTGSSDLWLASTSCSTSACNGVGGGKYDSSQSLPTGQTATVNYAEGEATGPVVWDAVQFGGYSIDHQALIAASTVNAEPLSSSFVGVLGLALPLNSVIAQKIPPTTSDAPDGAAITSNIFGITPTGTAPSARFLSVALERPGSDRVSSTLGIGRHPAGLVPDPSKVQYSSVVAESAGSLWWQANVRQITVYVNGQAKVVSLPQSGTGTRGQPSAILDTGVPLIVASPALAYGIYGAMGYSPAADGTVYIPCNQPLNMSITLDDRSEIPIHPLDLTFYPSDDPSAENCIGAIQTPAQIGATFTQADMVLGVPFLRNTYTVLGYDTPNSAGVFPNNTGASSRVQPRLGLMPLTDPATAAAEFHQVRVLRQPITSGSGSGTTSAGSVQSSPKKGLSVGIEVLIGLVGFFGLCFVLFGARLVYMKRKWLTEKRAGAGPRDGSIGADSKEGSYVLNELGYRPASRKSHSSAPSEDELRMKRYEEYKRRRDMESSYTDSTTTRVGDDDNAPDEFGALNAKGPGRESPREDTFRDPWGETTLTDGRPLLPFGSETLALPPPTARRASYTPASPPPAARRTSYGPASPLAHHRTPSGGPGSATPLLSHTRSYSNPQDSDIAEFGFPFDRNEVERPVSMAGVGTQGRSRRLGSAGSSAGLGLPSPLLSPSDRALPPSPLASPALLSPRALEPVFSTSTSRNESRVSLTGHEP